MMTLEIAPGSPPMQTAARKHRNPTPKYDPDPSGRKDSHYYVSLTGSTPDDFFQHNRQISSDDSGIVAVHHNSTNI
jgi:hypothetical protein